MSGAGDWYHDKEARDRTILYRSQKENGQITAGERILDRLLPPPSIGQIFSFLDEAEDDPEEYTVTEVEWGVSATGAVELFIVLRGASLNVEPVEDLNP